MLSIDPFPIYINPLQKINCNANINVGTFYHDIVEYNNEKSDI